MVGNRARAAVGFRLRGEGGHEGVEKRNPIESGTPLRLAYSQPPPRSGQDRLGAAVLCRLDYCQSFPIAGILLTAKVHP